MSAQGLITNALFLGDKDSFNTSLADCVWKRTNDRASCPDPDVQIILYTNDKTRSPQKVDNLFETPTVYLLKSGG